MSSGNITAGYDGMHAGNITVSNTEMLCSNMTVSNDLADHYGITIGYD